MSRSSSGRRLPSRYSRLREEGGKLSGIIRGWCVGGNWGPEGGDDEDQSRIRGPPPPFSFPGFPSPAPLPPSQCLEAAFTVPGGEMVDVRECLCFYKSVCLGGSQGTLTRNREVKTLENHVPGLGKINNSDQWPECWSIHSGTQSLLIVCRGRHQVNSICRVTSRQMLNA